MIQLLNEAIQALENRDAVTCYESTHSPCQCTLCKLKRMRDFIESNELTEEINSILSHAVIEDADDWQLAVSQLDGAIKYEWAKNQ